eukprot:2127085-Rhodomonas_salina.1
MNPPVSSSGQGSLQSDASSSFPVGSPTHLQLNAEMACTDTCSRNTTTFMLGPHLRFGLRVVVCGMQDWLGLIMGRALACGNTMKKSSTTAYQNASTTCSWTRNKGSP